MDGIIGLGHFCETHGPCIILNTQRFTDSPTRQTQNLVSCDACQSIPADQVFLSKDENITYLSSRVPLIQHTAFLLKQAAIRSLSCEQESTMYFGDNDQGHVYSHSFVLHDSLARGFQRKYVILFLMLDKLNLLNEWQLISQEFKNIAKELTNLSLAINESEQRQKSQRAVRQLQSSSIGASRSLSQLTGRPTIYAYLHFWFTWILGCNLVVEKPFKGNLLPVPKPSSYLRNILQQLGRDDFNVLLGAFLSGFKIDCFDDNILCALNSIWPDDFKIISEESKETCKIIFGDDGKVHFEFNNVVLPMVPSQLQNSLIEALCDNQLSEKALEPQMSAIIMNWMHIANVLQWCPQIDKELLKNLNVQKVDLPLLNVLISNRAVLTNLNQLFNS